jgi:hypothetical protein
LTAITPKVDANVGRGFFKEPFQLVLTCPDGSATIRYTTDFTEPTASNGIVYSGPITISETTCLRAVAFSTGKLPSVPLTQSYIYLDQVLTQPNVKVGFPTNWGPNASFTGGVVPADYEMDTDPLRVDPNNATSAVDPVKQQRLKDGLRELPLLSVTLPVIDMFGTNGIYYSTHVQDKNFGYKKCAAEMILPDGSSAFSVICGISGHGNASRDPLKNPKHGFQLKFKGDYGEGSLTYRLFPESPVENYDDIILRPDFNSSWRHWSDSAGNGNGSFQRTRATRIRDAWSKETFRTMGGLASHHRFVHLFINGLYWGTYDLAEQPVEGFAQEQMGGDKADYSIVHEGNLKNGADTVYSTMTAMPNITTNALYDQMKGYLDINEFIDYTLLHFYVGHQDWGSIKNWYAIRRRASANNPVEGKYQYVPWDQECTLLDTTVNRVSNTDVPSGLHTKLVGHLQYRLDFADRVHRHLIAPGGALTAAATVARWQKWQALLDKPIAGESCRWGDYRRDVHPYQDGTFVLYTRENQWLAECTRLTGTYFPGRPATLLSQIQSANLYPSAAAPQLRQNTTTGTIIGTSQVAAGSVVAMSNPGGAGTIYYTTDGNDPHIYYTPTTGATITSVAPTAVIYSTPITINSTTTVKARILSSTGVWSALNEATFSVGLALPAVHITEIMYNPPGGNAHEFIEIQNTGTAPVDLSGWFFQGVDFYFPFGTVLGAGGRMVLANNDGKTGAFGTQYPGIAVAGYFGGSMDNGGERLALLDATGRTIESVDYDDVSPWPTAPDGVGYSLERIDPQGNPDDPFNWKASAVVKGSAGQPNSTLPAQNVELSEIQAVGAAVNGFVELRNKTAVPVDISGWQILSPGGLSPIPPGTSIPASGYHVATVFGLPSPGGTVQVFTSSAQSVRVDAVSWGNQVPGYTIGRIGGVWQLCAPTLGSANAAAPVAPTTSLALNEWLANSGPAETDWIEIYNKHATLPAALRGVFVKSSTQLDQIDALAFIAPGGWLQLFCDEKPGADQLDLTLPVEGTTLTLLDPSGTAFDTVTFGAQIESVTQGRLPDGTGPVMAFNGSASPGATNYLTPNTGPLLNEVLAYNVNSDRAPWGTPAAWVELVNTGVSALDLTGFRIGRGDFATAWPFPAGTTIPIAGYLPIWCDGTRAGSTAASANLNTGFGLSSSDDSIFVYDAIGQIVSRIEWGSQAADRSIGRYTGTWQLLGSPTRGFANAQPAVLGNPSNLRINEWSSATATDWFELYNLDVNPVFLSGLYLTDDPSEIGRKKYSVPPLSFVGGNGWAVFTADGKPALGGSHTNFNLSSSGEYLRVSNNDATLIDSVSFGTQTAANTGGRLADGTSTISNALAPTPGGRNALAATTTPAITSQSGNRTVFQGDDVTLTVSAIGPALGYQWNKNGNPVPGANTTSLALSSVSVSDAGSYTCVVSNGNGSDTSQPITVTVLRTYDQWCAAFGIAGASPAGDADNDGINNLAEFLHDLNPVEPASENERLLALPQIGVEPPTGTPTYLTLTYRRSASLSISDIAHELSSTLASGSWAIKQPDAVENLSPDPATGDSRVRLKFLVGPSEAHKFIRLELVP